MSSKKYSIVTDRICSILEREEIPWRKPWDETGGHIPIINGKRSSGSIVKNNIYR